MAEPLHRYLHIFEHEKISREDEATTNTGLIGLIEHARHNLWIPDFYLLLALIADFERNPLARSHTELVERG